MPTLLLAETVERPNPESIYNHRAAQHKEIDKALADHAQWATLMEEGFTAQRYDSYSQRHFELATSVWKRDPSLSPSVALIGLWSHNIPDLMYMRMFSDIRVHQAEEAFARGDLKGAEQLLRELNSFGERIFTGSSTDIEKLIGLAIAKDVSTEMGKFYKALGLTSEAEKAASRVQQTDERVAKFRHRFEPTLTTRMSGIVLQALAALAVIAALAALLGILALELLPARFGGHGGFRRKALARAVDYAPSGLLVANGAFLVSFVPFARALARFRNAPDFASGERQIAEALFGLEAVPIYVVSADGKLLVWYAITLGLVGFTIMMIARIIYKVRHVSATHT